MLGEDAVPLALFHFSGFRPEEDPTLLTSYFDTPQPERYRQLCLDYAECLNRQSPRIYEELGYELDTWADGTEIPNSSRELIRAQIPSFADIEDPWDLVRHPNLPARLFAASATAQSTRTSWSKSQDLGSLRLTKRSQGARRNWLRWLRRKAA